MTLVEVPSAPPGWISFIMEQVNIRDGDAVSSNLSPSQKKE